MFVNGHDIQFHLGSGAIVNVLLDSTRKPFVAILSLKELKTSEVILAHAKRGTGRD